MKVYIAICLIMVAFASTVCPVTKAAKDLVNGFFSKVKPSVVLNDNCFGANTDALIGTVIQSINEENFFGLLAGVTELVTDVTNNCPLNEFKAVVDEIASQIDSKVIATHLLQNQNLLMGALKDLINEKIDLEAATKVGQDLGYIYNLATLDNPTNFLAIEDNVADLVNGILEGLSSVPYGKNKCKNDVESILPDILASAEAFADAIKIRNGVVEAAKNLYAVIFIHASSLETNCHFTKLVKALSTIASTLGVTKVAYRVTKQLPTVIIQIKNIRNAFNNNDNRAAGVAFGKIISIGLDYTTQ